MLKSPVMTALLSTTALVASVFIVVPLQAANVPLLTGPTGSNPAQFPADLPDINNTLNAINSSGATGINPNTLAPYATPRNFIDNGGMAVQQRGTTAIVGGTTSGCDGKSPAGGYTADRWCIDTNVTSGAGKGVTNTTTSQLTGFSGSMTVFRNSASLTQQVCAIQEIPSADTNAMRGQTVVLSSYLQALSGLAADNGNVVGMTLIYGTGSDEGLGTMTSAPAITPAWTGINSSITANKTITTGWVRYTVSGTIPTTAKEAGVEICFKPAKGTSGGATDGFIMTGVQLEVGSTPSSFEFRQFGVELARAEQFATVYNELGTTSSVQALTGILISTVNCTGLITFPVAMRAAPSYTNQLTATTWSAVAGTLAMNAGVALSTPFSGTNGANSINSASVSLTTAGSMTGAAAGSFCEMVSKAGAGVMVFSADF